MGQNDGAAKAQPQWKALLPTDLMGQREEMGLQKPIRLSTEGSSNFQGGSEEATPHPHSPCPPIFSWCLLAKPNVP